MGFQLEKKRIEQARIVLDQVVEQLGRIKESFRVQHQEWHEWTDSEAHDSQLVVGSAAGCDGDEGLQ